MARLSLILQDPNVEAQSYNLTEDLARFRQLLLSADGHKLELFHTEGEEMLLAALNFWVHYFHHPLKSMMPLQVMTGNNNDSF